MEAIAYLFRLYPCERFKMPLYENAVEQIRANLERIANGEKVQTIAIGRLTDAQMSAIETVMEQIVNALSERSQYVPTHTRTLIQDRTGRVNEYGEFIRDEAVLECSAKYPRPELFSVIPKGEISPNERKAARFRTASSF